MVLAELGSKITSALRKLNDVTIVDEEAIAKLVKELQIALLQADVNVKIVKEISSNIKNKISQDEMPSGVNQRRIIQKTVFDELVRILNPERKPYKPKKGQANVLMFVGLQGNGKTTTIAKVAKYYRLKGWKVGMVCADTFRAGAFDQSRQNATRAKVPFYGSYEESDPVKIARDGVALFRKEKQDLILVDTSGRHKQEESLFEEMKQLHKAISPDDVIFVMDSTIGQAAMSQAKAFQSAVDVGSVIITKLDGHAKGGGALSAVATTGSPITFIGTGEQFDDFEHFDPRSFVKRMLGMGDIEGLMDKFRETKIFEKQPELLERFKKGFFSLRDMKGQFESVLKLGPLNKVMAMLPGLPQGMIPKGTDGAKRIKKFMYMMDSMTDAELDGIAQITKGSTRAMRIARGSGVLPEEVTLLLHYHKQMEKMVQKMGKTNLMKGDQQLNQQLARNPKAVMQQLAKSIDPRMLRQMGGAQNMMKMIKEMGKADMGDLQSMLGGAMGGARGLGGMAGRRRGRR